MKNRIVLSTLLVGAVCWFFMDNDYAYADTPAKIAYQDSSYSIFSATGIIGKSVPDTSDISVSSGVLKVFGIYISSPGVNSELRLYDNKLTGTATNQIGVSLKTDERIFIPFPIETDRGLVITSTATAGAFWSQPSLNIYYIRVR